MKHQVITLTTDFGLKDPYVVEMKAAILTVCPSATIIDISHDIEKFNIAMGAFVLASASVYFPRNTIHVGVVDPEVGTKRKSIVIQTRDCVFVGPDNGVLALAAKRHAIENAYEIANRKFMLPTVSNTFHGRDIFAPAAAYLANGIQPKELGPKVSDIVAPRFATILKRKDALIGEVIYVDGFGNIITNLSEKELLGIVNQKEIRIKLNRKTYTLKLFKTYGEAKKLQLLAIIGSHSFLEISANQGKAAEILRVNNGDKITVYRGQKSEIN